MHAAEFLLVIVLICLLGVLDVFNMLLEKLRQTVNTWKTMRCAWQPGDVDDAKNQASDAEPNEPTHQPLR
ncbi:hypothetical protein [Streptomyces sp. NBC_01236]|uniref:hypothetical protein n=1 Tax=Streptomyces sp. NBC_01236 TaxID=2903789 RepID=UPI002E127AB1|nr:hypothetical protein OG324_01960 [Streptomyces sp. NBC_01236]